MLNDKDFFCQRIRESETSMYALAYGILKNQEDAADTVQDAILKAYTNLDTLRDQNQFRPWIMRIVHNTAIAHLRSTRPTEDLDEQRDLAAPEPAVDTATRLTVWEAIQKLRLPYRLVIVLFYYRNCSAEQIAFITSTPTPTVRQQLSRGRKMLAGLLNKEDFLT